MRWSPLLAGAVLLLSTGCSSPAPATSEDRALQLCRRALQERVHAGKHPDEQGAAVTSQTQMIGRRSHGWLVRGLTVELADGARNYECKLDDEASGTPSLTYLRLCAAGGSPWGCPTGRPSS